MIFVTEGGERELEPDKLIKLVLSEEKIMQECPEK